jgi:aspartyl-tRNA(Asn)/glutamyl-tRNA(Gln) amidotransferase subunit A
MDLKGKTIKDIKASKELVAETLASAKNADKDINAFISFNDDLQDVSGKGVLAGIPASIKDNFNWTGTTTTAGSKILENYVSPYNATVTQRLLDAGAALIGKTNLDAFAHGSSTETSDFGVTKNPHNLERVAGGSSGGSAAAVAAGMSVYSIGSETAGSVRGPAAWCGVVGFAPTFGRNSRYGVAAMGSSLDRPGVLANSVEDVALVSEVIAGQDKYDATSIPEPAPKFAKELKTINLKEKKLKLGLPKQFLDDRIDKEVAEAAMQAVKEYEKLGAEIVEIDLMDPKYSIAVYTIVCRSEVSSNLARIDGIRYGYNSDKKAETILDQLALNRGEGFGNEAKQRSMTGAYALSAGYYDAYYKKAQQVRTLIIDDFKKAFEQVDAIVGPTMPTTAPKIGVTQGNPLFGELADMLTEPSALAGLPCISIPVGKDSDGLPIGFQIFAPQLQEQLVLDLAYTYEKEVGYGV